MINAEEGGEKRNPPTLLVECKWVNRYSEQDVVSLKS